MTGNSYKFDENKITMSFMVKNKKLKITMKYGQKLKD